MPCTLMTKLGKIANYCWFLLSKYSRGMNERLVRVSTSESKLSFQNLKKTVTHPHLLPPLFPPSRPLPSFFLGLPTLSQSTEQSNNI